LVFVLLDVVWYQVAWQQDCVGGDAGVPFALEIQRLPL
jgi:hypothetical protein